MNPKNNNIQVEPLKEGFISSSDGNIYRVVAISVQTLDYNLGDLIIIEDEMVVSFNVKGKQTYFVNHENIRAVIDGPKKDS